MVKREMFFCDPLGKGKVCPRPLEEQGKCGLAGSESEMRNILKYAPYKTLHPDAMHVADLCGGCPAAIVYALNDLAPANGGVAIVEADPTGNSVEITRLRKSIRVNQGTIYGV